MPGTKTETIDTTEERAYKGRYAAIIFNNETNSFDEVIDAIMIATSCGLDEARIETWEAHTYGQAAVHFDSEAECMRVASMISTIGVRTEVRREWDD